MGGRKLLHKTENKLVLTWDDIRTQVSSICRSISADAEGWRPDYVVGLVRGGTIPATMISHYFSVPMYALKISLRDSNSMDSETNCWMSEDAVGYNEVPSKNILVVDDINDTGKTLKWLRDDWESTYQIAGAWKHVWGYNVRFATIVDNTSSLIHINYAGKSINKKQNDVWVEFPWEDWWLK